MRRSALSGTFLLACLALAFRGAPGAVALGSPSSGPRAPGGQLWVERYDGLGNGDDVARNLAVSPDGSRVFVAGDSVGPSGDRDYGTVAYDASTGTQLWGMAYDGPGNGTDEAFALGVSPGGSEVFVTGSSAGSSVG